MKENIEDTIKQLQIILKTRKKQEEIIECAGGFCRNCKPDIEALESSINILSDYKRLEQKELRLEKEVEIAKEALKKQCDIVDERNQLLREKQKLQKGNEELNKIKSLIEILKVNAMEDEKYIVITKGSFFDGSFKFLLNDYLPKQKIKDKIEEYKRDVINLDIYPNFSEQELHREIIDILQDLLEEKGE